MTEDPNNNSPIRNIKPLLEFKYQSSNKVNDLYLLKVVDLDGYTFFIDFENIIPEKIFISEYETINLDHPIKNGEIPRSIREGNFRLVSDMVIGIVFETKNGLSITKRDKNKVNDYFYPYSPNKKVKLNTQSQYPAYPLVRYSILSNSFDVTLNRVHQSSINLAKIHTDNYLQLYMELLEKYKKLNDEMSFWSLENEKMFEKFKKDDIMLSNMPPVVSKNRIRDNFKLRDNIYRDLNNLDSIIRISNLVDELSLEIRSINENIDKGNKILGQFW